MDEAGRRALLQYVKEFQADIYVRDRVDGVWGSYSLAELPADRVEYWFWRFLVEGVVPHRIKGGEEDSSDGV